MAGVVGKMEKGPNMVMFTTDTHELEFVDCGAGLAVMAPEWDGMALVLTKADVLELKTLCEMVLARP